MHVNYARARSLACSALHLLPLSSSGRGSAPLSPIHRFFYCPRSPFLRNLLPILPSWLSSLSLSPFPIASEYSITERIRPGNRNNIDYKRRLSDCAKTVLEVQQSATERAQSMKMSQKILRLIRVERRADCRISRISLCPRLRSSVNNKNPLGKICFFKMRKISTSARISELTQPHTRLCNHFYNTKCIRHPLLQFFVIRRYNDTTHMSLHKCEV